LMAPTVIQCRPLFSPLFAARSRCSVICSRGEKIGQKWKKL